MLCYYPMSAYHRLPSDQFDVFMLELWRLKLSMIGFKTFPLSILSLKSLIRLYLYNTLIRFFRILTFLVILSCTLRRNTNSQMFLHKNWITLSLACWHKPCEIWLFMIPYYFSKCAKKLLTYEQQWLNM